MSFDRYFKLALLVTLLGFLFVGWTIAENGRYIYHANAEYEAGASIVDSRTGALYILVAKDGNGLFVELRPQTGERIPRSIWTRGPSK
jgi:hypothetical protein